MRKIFNYAVTALKTFSACVKEAARQARENAETPGRCGFREFRETEGGPPLFYTETCPEGTYLIGVIEADLGLDTALKDRYEADMSKMGGFIVPEDDGSDGTQAVRSVTEK